MEKILLVMCGAAPTKNALNFACYLSNMTRSKLTGFFFENENYAAEPELKIVSGMPYAESIPNSHLREHAGKLDKTAYHMRDFELICENKGISASIKYLEDNILENIIEESRFADLIIADAAVSYISKTQEAPSPLLQDLLATAQCPVIIAPSSFTPVNEVVFCYDGSPSAVFAMKQLTYLLPELGEAKATVFQMSDEEMPAAKRKRMMTWLSHHFESSDIITIKGNSDQVLFEYLLKKQHALVVMGAYGRSMVSRLFRHSHADLLIKTLAYPLFITHY
ncbi:universal stress protein [Chitinophaga sp.]|uniref:universal stress protein n=1 Tax=Chitinophaga sp. TaxID=1869181 RepID=UPI002F929EBD